MARGRRGRRSTQRSRNRARNRARAQRAAKKRVSARKAAGRKPSGANKAANRAAARARAQAAAKARNAAKAKAADQKKARTAAAQRASNEAAARKRAQDAARQRREAADATRASSFNNQVKQIQKNQSIGPVRDGATYARNLTNYNMKFGATPEIRAKAYEQSLNPKSFKGLSDGQTFGVGPVASGDAYARGLNTDNQNVENRLRQVRNLGSTLTGGLIPSVRKLTDKEISDRRMKVAAQREANFMGRRTGGKGTSRIEQQAEAARFLPEIAPTIGTPPEEYDMGPSSDGDLTRIQSQAYNEQLSNLMIGGTGSTGYTQQGSPELSPTLKAGQSRGRRRVRLFGGRRRRGGAGDQFSRAGDRIAKLTNINIYQ